MIQEKIWSLSPLLFLVIAEAFGVMEGFEVGNEGLTMSHVQFASNTLVMCKNSVRQLKYLRCTIRCFEAVTDLRVNLSISSIFGVGMVDDLWRFADVLGCQKGSLPSSYLGLPLGALFKCNLEPSHSKNQ